MLQNIYYSKVLKAINSSFNTVLFNNLLYANVKNMLKSY